MIVADFRIKDEIETMFEHAVATLRIQGNFEQPRQPLVVNPDQRFAVARELQPEVLPVTLDLRLDRMPEMPSTLLAYVKALSRGVNARSIPDLLSDVHAKINEHQLVPTHECARTGPAALQKLRLKLAVIGTLRIIADRALHESTKRMRVFTVTAGASSALMPVTAYQILAGVKALHSLSRTSSQYAPAQILAGSVTTLAAGTCSILLARRAVFAYRHLRYTKTRVAKLDELARAIHPFETV